MELHFRNGGPSISGMNHTALEDKLGYRFNNPDLLVQALTHPSTDSKPETRRAYERLEFLGDAILQLAVTQYLYHHMPQSPEGELTQLRARTVSRANLGKYGFMLGADEFSKLIYKAKKIFDANRKDLEKERTDDEFMAMYEQYEAFDELEEVYLEMEEQVTALIASYVDEHLELFAKIIK